MGTEEYKAAAGDSAQVAANFQTFRDLIPDPLVAPSQQGVPKHFDLIAPGTAQAIRDELDALELSVTDGPNADTNNMLFSFVERSGVVSAGANVVYSEMLNGLDAAGILDKLDGLWLFAAESTKAALLNIVRDTDTAAVNKNGGDVTFNKNVSYKSDGLAFIKSSFTPSTDAKVATADSFSAGVIATFASKATENTILAITDSTNIIDMLITPSTGVVKADAGVDSAMTGVSALTIGMLAVTRDGKDISLIEHGNVDDTDTKDAYKALPAAEMLLLSKTAADTALHAAFIGEFMTPTELSTMDGIVKDAITAMGAL